MSCTEPAIREFARRLCFLLMFRAALRCGTVWLLGVGVALLVARVTGLVASHWLIGGLAGLVPIVGAAAWVEWRRRPQLAAVRAAMDRHNQAGGLLMAAAQADVSAWQSRTKLAQPNVRWNSGRPITLFAAAALFLGAAMLMPERFIVGAAQRPLDVGKLVTELTEQITALEEEKILPEDKALELKKELARLGKESAAKDPAKTWESLDHLKQSNADLAKQAAEEAIQKTDTMKQAETLAAALGLLPDSASALLERAMQDMASLLQQAKLEQGLLAAKLPEELLKAAQDGKLSPEQLKELVKALQGNKAKLAEGLNKLANLKLIDPKLLEACKNAGQGPNPDGLAAFLAENGANLDSLLQVVQSYGQGGVNRGRGDAPLTWTDPSDESGMKFKDTALPMGPLSGLKDAQLVGISRNAPEVTNDKETARAGALSGAEAGGGAANVQQLLPRHKGAVQRFFKREN
ncbi:MAG: hypothetical protein FJ406_08735 [Verrucomicrobia bacterium]|nr:hypothetical protein [Verrucomicrobiota bacterium]